MDSITKLQGKLHQAEEILQYVSKELEGYGENKTVGENLNFSALKLRGEQYSFYEHPIKGKLFCDGYLALLIYVISLGGKKEEGWTLLYRITAACDYQGELQSLTTDAMTLTEERISELIRGICEAKLERTFAIDTMMISHHMGADDAQLQFLAGLYELMTIDKNFLAEAIQFVKIFDSTFWDNLADKSREWKFLTARDIATYIGAYPADSLDEAAKLEHKRVVIKDITYTSKDVLNLDDWKADEILFLQCRFEKCGGIFSNDKIIKFSECVFDGNVVRFADSKEYRYLSIYRWTNDKYSSYKAFIQIRTAFFVNCKFKNFLDAVPMLHLGSGEIYSCNFENCCQEYGGSMLMNMNNAKVTKNQFLSCKSSVYLCGGSTFSHNHSGHGCLIYSSNSIFEDNRFLNCINDVTSGEDYGGISCILLLNKNSQCRKCFFENNFTSGKTYRSKFNGTTIGLTDSQQYDNTGDFTVGNVNKISEKMFIVGDKQYDD